MPLCLGLFQKTWLLVTCKFGTGRLMFWGLIFPVKEVSRCCGFKVNHIYGVICAVSDPHFYEVLLVVAQCLLAT